MVGRIFVLLLLVEEGLLVEGVLLVLARRLLVLLDNNLLMGLLLLLFPILLLFISPLELLFVVLVEVLTLRIRSVSINTSLSIMMLSFNSSSLKDDIRDTDGRRLVLVELLRRDGSRDMDGLRLSSSVVVLVVVLSMGDLD